MDWRSCSLLIATNYNKWIIPYIYIFLSHADYNLKEKKEVKVVPVPGVLVIKGLSIGLSDACMLGFKKKS